MGILDILINCLCDHSYSTKSIKTFMPLNLIANLSIPILQILEFEDWKEALEEKECCSFVKATGGKKPRNVQYYQCNRGGEYKSKASGKRRQKSQGAMKYFFMQPRYILSLRSIVALDIL